MTNLNPQSWQAIDALGRRLGEITIEKERIEGQFNLKINDIKERESQKLAPLVNEKKAIEKAIQSFCEAHKAEFADKRSKEMPFIKVGYRLVKSVSVPRVKEKLNSLLKAIKSYGYADSCIVYEEKPDKEALSELPDEDLVRLGIKRTIKDSFRIEPKLESLSEKVEPSKETMEA